MIYEPAALFRRFHVDPARPYRVERTAGVVDMEPAAFRAAMDNNHPITINDAALRQPGAIFRITNVRKPAP